MTLEPRQVKIIQLLLKTPSLDEVEQARLKTQLSAEGLAELQRQEETVALLQRHASLINLSPEADERILRSLQQQVQATSSGIAASGPAALDGFRSVVSWLADLTARVADSVRQRRVFALGSLGGESNEAACEVPLEHPNLGGMVVIRRVDAVHVEVCVNMESGSDPGLAVVLRDGARRVLKPNRPELINTDRLPRKGLAPPTLEFTIREDISE